MFLNHLFNRAIGVSMVLLFFHSYAGAQVAPETQRLQFPTMLEIQQDGRFQYSATSSTSYIAADSDLCALLVSQAELQAQNHLNSRGRAELVVVDNAVARGMICPAVFERPIKLMKREEIQRAKISAYIEFEEVNMLEADLVTAKYKLICTEGCSSWQYDLKLKIYEGTSNWAIIQNASAPIRVEPTNK